MGRCTKNIQAQVFASQWSDSGMTQAKYARQNNLSVYALKYWLYKKEKKGKEAGAFVELKHILRGDSIILKYSNGVELQLPAGTPVQTLKFFISLKPDVFSDLSPVFFIPGPNRYAEEF
jgi:hypothetical protein